jgi:hypothetical protein
VILDETQVLLAFTLGSEFRHAALSVGIAEAFWGHEIKSASLLPTLELRPCWDGTSFPTRINSATQTR